MDVVGMLYGYCCHHWDLKGLIGIFTPRWGGEGETSTYFLTA